MAKITGPLMSMDASGKFGGTLVFGKWKGRNVARQLVTPANPQSAGQQATRNALRALGAGQAWVNANAAFFTGETITPKAALALAAPAGQAWNGYLVKSAIGTALINYEAATTIYAALQAAEKTAWVDAAAALTPAIPAVAQIDAGGAAGTPLTAGQVYFQTVYGLYIAGAYGSIPGATPPTFAA